MDTSNEHEEDFVPVSMVIHMQSEAASHHSSRLKMLISGVALHANAAPSSPRSPQLPSPFLPRSAPSKTPQYTDVSAGGRTARIRVCVCVCACHHPGGAAGWRSYQVVLLHLFWCKHQQFFLRLQLVDGGRSCCRSSLHRKQQQSAGTLPPSSPLIKYPPIRPTGHAGLEIPSSAA